ncbi:MAG: preprotein translocase subunit YajC [Bacteroidota bacterium]|nr:preprotein translocase subunit YajC [Bacteroidota bacterium]MDX5468631.1 preprotein translocase subunit YajC [Bacteroidota bacterium]
MSQQGGAGGAIQMVLILVVVFVFMILPQIRRNKETKKFRSTIGKGDKVVLTAGIHGKIVGEDDDTYMIETENQGRLKVDKAAVSMESTKAVYPKEA